MKSMLFLAFALASPHQEKDQRIAVLEKENAALKAEIVELKKAANVTEGTVAFAHTDRRLVPAGLRHVFVGGKANVVLATDCEVIPKGTVIGPNLSGFKVKLTLDTDFPSIAIKAEFTAPQSKVQKGTNQ